MWQTRKEKERDDIPLTQVAFPEVQTHFSEKERVASPFCPEAERTTSVGQSASRHPAPNSLLPADLGFLHGAQVGVIDEALLPVPAPRQGGVLLQDRGVLLLGSRVIL